MRTKKVLYIVLIIVFLASAVSLAVTSAAAMGQYEKKIPFSGEDDELTKDELVNAILPYMLDEGTFTLDDVGDAAYVCVYWDGEPKTIIDMAEREVTLYRPAERVYAHSVHGTRTVVQLGAKDKLIAISASIKQFTYGEPGRSKYFSPLHRAAPELEDLPAAGSYIDPALEFILSLKPDVVLASPSFADTIQENTGIPVVADAIVGGDLSFRMHRVIGKAVEKEKETEELISYVNEKLAEIAEVTSQISDSEKPKVFLAHRPGATGLDKGMCRYDPIEIAGGTNVFGEDCTGASVEVSKEQLIAWNPDIILMGSNPSKVHPLSIEDVLSDPDIQTINAVKNESVYYTKGCMMGWDPVTVTTESFYFAKLFHPEKFKDLDVEETCNEIMERFYGVDGLFTEMTEKCDLYKWE